MAMSNADRIRAMSDKELADFIFKWQVNFISEFLTNGFVNAMNAQDMRAWMKEPGNPHPIFEKWDGEQENEAAP